MMRFQWNALRVGDRVIVHDATDADLSPVGGVVAMVDTRTGADYGSNDLGIRISPVGVASNVVRPARLAVHLDPIDPAESCWRCDAIAAR